MLKKNIILMLVILKIVQTVKCQQNYQSASDVFCERVELKDFDLIGSLQTCMVKTSSIVEITSNTDIRSVKFSITPKTSIEGFHVDSSERLKFVPSGIKPIFPNLRAFGIKDSLLMHVDKQDMKQFGTDLLWVRFLRTKLTALEGDLFDFNPNLIYIDFDGNLLKYIDPKLFESFKSMNGLNEVDFNNCRCMIKLFRKRIGDNIQTYNWSANSCNDISAKNTNIERIHGRKIKSEDKDDNKIVNKTLDIIRNELRQEVDKLRVTLSGVEMNLSNANVARTNNLSGAMEMMETRIISKFDILLNNAQHNIDDVRVNMDNYRKCVEGKFGENFMNITKQMELINDQVTKNELKVEDKLANFSMNINQELESRKESTDEALELLKNETSRKIIEMQNFENFMASEVSENITILQESIDEKIEQITQNLTRFSLLIYELLQKSDISTANQEFTSSSPTSNPIEVEEELKLIKDQMSLIEDQVKDSTPISFIITSFSIASLTATIIYIIVTLKKIKNMIIAGQLLSQELK